MLRDELEPLSDEELDKVVREDPSEYRAWIAFNILWQRKGKK